MSKFAWPRTAGRLKLAAMRAKQNTQVFRALRADEVDLSYELYQQVRAWLQMKEIRLWLAPLPKEKFIERQARGELFGMFLDDELAVILAIVPEMPPYWQTEIGTTVEWWLSTVATAPTFRGRELGRLAIAKSVDRLKVKQVARVYLDCASGFLPRYYERNGFGKLAEKDVSFPSGNTYRLVLMSKAID